MKTQQVVILSIFIATLFLTYLNIYEVSNLLLPGGLLHRASLKRVDKHFFFELLSQYDPVVLRESFLTSLCENERSCSTLDAEVKESKSKVDRLHKMKRQSQYATQYKPLLPSDFKDVVDRTLLVQYLTERFAYSSFLQISCQSQRTYQLLPDAQVTTKLCVDAKGGGTHTIDPIKFISDTVISRTAAALSAAAAASKTSGFRGGSSSSSTHAPAEKDGRRYDIILVESKHLTLSITILDTLLELLADGGVLILTDTTMFHSSWREVYSLRQRDNLDCATLDADYGLTIVAKRHNKTPLDFSKLGLHTSNSSRLQLDSSAVDNLAAATTTTITTTTTTTSLSSNSVGVSANEGQHPLFSSNPKSITSEGFSSEMHRILNLMTFEDLHVWLAATGNVDVLTAFGGKRGLDVYRESVEFRDKCTKILSNSLGSNVDKTLTCFNDALIAGRLSLMARWQLAMLLMGKDRLVDAVTMLGELQGISPAFYKWIILETSMSFAPF